MKQSRPFISFNHPCSYPFLSTSYGSTGSCSLTAVCQEKVSRLHPSSIVYPSRIKPHSESETGLLPEPRLFECQALGGAVREGHHILRPTNQTCHLDNQSSCKAAQYSLLCNSLQEKCGVSKLPCYQPVESYSSVSNFFFQDYTKPSFPTLMLNYVNNGWLGKSL